MFVPEHFPKLKLSCTVIQSFLMVLYIHVLCDVATLSHVLQFVIRHVTVMLEAVH